MIKFNDGKEKFILNVRRYFYVPRPLLTADADAYSVDTLRKLSDSVKCQ